MSYRLLSGMAFVLWMLYGPVRTDAQLVVTITALPDDTPASSSLFIAGNFQGWVPGEEAYRLKRNPSGVWYTTLQPAAGLLRFKFTRGGWDMVESDERGGFLADREYVFTGGPDTLRCRILGWEDRSPEAGSPGTAGPGVRVLREDFHMPQLDRYRRVWIYLPPDYHRTDKHYPVIYLQDGQNLFDRSLSFSGEWEVDESMDTLFYRGAHGYLVVGIDNGGDRRMDEYAPWYNPTYQRGGEGAAYADFLANTLKPYVDKHFRTLPGKDHTAIAGSSLGALVAHYAFVEYPEVFGRLGAFSPAYWYNPEIYDFTRRRAGPAPKRARVWWLAGLPEGGGRVREDVDRMHATMLAAGYQPEDLEKRLHADGQHQEWYWAREFPGAVEWMFRDFPGNFARQGEDVAAAVPYGYVDPTRRLLFLGGIPELRTRPMYRLTDPAGVLLRKGRLEKQNLDIADLPPGTYMLQVRPRRKRQWTVNFEVK